MTCRLEEPDYVPLSQDFAFNPVRIPWSRYTSHFEHVEYLLSLGTDPWVHIWQLDVRTHPDVKVTDWEENDPDGPYPLMCRAYETPAGPLTMKVRKTLDWAHTTHEMNVCTTLGNALKREPRLELADDYNVSRLKEPVVKGPADLDAFRYIIQPPQEQELAQWREDALIARQFARKHDLPVIYRRTTVADFFLYMCNIEDFLIAMIDQPGFVEEFLAIVKDWALWWLEQALDIGVDIAHYKGFYETPDYFGGHHYARFVAPIIQEFCRITHEAGALACYVLAEGATAQLENLKQLDIDILWHVDPGGAWPEDRQLLKDELGNRIAFWGGINQRKTVIESTPDQVRSDVREAIALLGPGGGYVMQASPGIHDMDCTEEMFLTFVEAWKEFRDYPISC